MLCWTIKRRKENRTFVTEGYDNATDWDITILS